jgi:hypothetical protein
LNAKCLFIRLRFFLPFFRPFTCIASVSLASALRERRCRACANRRVNTISGGGVRRLCGQLAAEKALPPPDISADSALLCVASESANVEMVAACMSTYVIHGRVPSSVPLRLSRR